MTKPPAQENVEEVKKLLITVTPGIGKTTPIKTIARILKPFHPVGFYTEEIREQGTRLGFQLVSLDGRVSLMSHVRVDVDIPSIPKDMSVNNWTNRASKYILPVWTRKV